MATTPKRIQRIQGPISALNAGQIGVEDTVDADLGFRMHGGKDGAGGVTKWLAKDKPARVSEMTVQDLAGSGERVMSVDSNGKLMLGSGLVVPEHKTSHQLGGADALNVGGLSGALADGQKTNADLKTLRGAGSLASKLYSAAGLQNAWAWGNRIETEDGELLHLHHDPFSNTRAVRLVGGQQNQNAVVNPDFTPGTSGWTASVGTTFIRLGLDPSDWPEPYNLTDQSAEQSAYCGRANKNTDAPFGVSQTGVLEVGKRYRCTGWINNYSGTSEIVAYVGGVAVGNATAANPNVWKYFDVEITASGTDIVVQSEPTGTENSIFLFSRFRVFAIDANEARIEIDADGGQHTVAKSGTRTIEKDLAGSAVEDIEYVKNIGIAATDGQTSAARKVIVVESLNDTFAEMGLPGRVTLSAEAFNEAFTEAPTIGAGAISVDAFDGLAEKRIVSSGILGGTTFHDIIAQSFLVNGEPQGVQFVTTVADTPHAMTIASAKKIIFEGSASNSPCVLPAANSTATLSDGTVVNMRGRSFELVNANSEFIPVQNYGTASSVFELLGPGCTLTATCTGTSTAAGTWATKKEYPSGYKRTFREFEEYVGPTGAGIFGMYTFVGTGSAATGGGNDVPKSRGVAQAVVGTDAGLGGFVVAHTLGYIVGAGRALLNEGIPRSFECKFTQLNRSDATNETVVRIGYNDSITIAKPDNGIYIETNQTDIIRGVTRAAASENVVASAMQTKLTNAGQGQTVINGVVNAACTRADFWAEKTYIGSLALTLPKTAVLNFGFQISRVAGVVSNRIYVDTLIEESPE